MCVFATQGSQIGVAIMTQTVLAIMTQMGVAIMTQTVVVIMAPMGVAIMTQSEGCRCHDTYL